MLKITRVYILVKNIVFVSRDNIVNKASNNDNVKARFSAKIV